MPELYITAISGADALSSSSVGDAFTVLAGSKLQVTNTIILHPTLRFIRTSPGTERWSIDTKATFNSNIMLGVMYQRNGLFQGF